MGLISSWRICAWLDFCPTLSQNLLYSPLRETAGSSGVGWFEKQGWNVLWAGAVVMVVWIEGRATLPS